MRKERLKNLYDGFEGNTLSEIWSKNKFEPRAIKIQSQIVRKGKKALRITIQKGDRKEEGNKHMKTSERDELLERKEFGPHEDESYAYSFSIFIPKDFPIVPTRLVLAQWKQNDAESNATVDNPILALRYVNGELFITLQTTEKKNRIFSTKEEVRGRWIDFKFHVKFSREKSGFIKIWIDNKETVNYKGKTAYSEKYKYPKPGRFYFKIGLYRDRMDKPMTIYIDEFYNKRLI